MLEPLLQSLALGKVVEDPLPVERFACFVLQEDRLLTDPDPRPVLGQQAVLFAEGLLVPRLEALVGGQYPLPIVGVEALGPQLALPPLLGGITKHLLYLGTGVERRLRVIYRVNVGDGRDLVNQGTETLLRSPEPRLGPLALRYVYLYPKPVERFPLFVPDERRLVPDPHRAPVPGESTIFHDERLFGLVGAQILGQDRLPVVGMKRSYPEVRGRGALLWGVSQDVHNLGADIHGFAGAAYLLDVGNSRYLLDEHTVPFLGLPETVFGLLPPRDVPGVDHVSTHAWFLDQVRADRLEPAPGTVLMAKAILGRRMQPRVFQALVVGHPHPLIVVGVHIIEGVLPEEFLLRVAEHPRYGRALVADYSGGLYHSDEVRRVLGKGAVAFLAVAHPGVEASPANGQVHELGHGDHHPQVVLRQLHPVHALQVEEAHSLALIEERDADLGGHTLHGSRGVRVGAHIFHEQGKPGADGSRADALRQGDPPGRLVVPGLVLEHQVPAFEQIGAQPGEAVGLGYGLHRPGEYAGYLQLTRYCRANPVEEGQLPRLAAKPLLGPSALRDVTYGDRHALEYRVPSRSPNFMISELFSTTVRMTGLVFAVGVTVR